MQVPQRRETVEKHGQGSSEYAVPLCVGKFGICRV